MTIANIKPGQRWVSDAEPELGLGVVLSAKFGRVEILFPAAEERREYALESAPVRRVAFAAGDEVTTHEGKKGVVEDLREQDGFLHYQLNGEWIPEAALADTISFSSPVDRLQGGQTESTATYILRLEALEWQAKIRQAPVRGMVGARIDLIDHQLYITDTVTRRLVPRVLLADEVGLGKTIEACLIMHRLRMTGRADRTLIVLPEPLMHQWFVELLRRFNTMATLFDDKRCKEVEMASPGCNPFAEAQVALVPLPMLVKSEKRVSQLVEAGWDLLIVDEAHHLEWSEAEASPAYQAVEALATAIEGVLLLTATPEQLGAAGHFARLRLLDPDRYSDLRVFAAEEGHYEEAAVLIAAIKSETVLSESTRQRITEVVPHLGELLEGPADAGLREALVRGVLDTFGTGRVIFRNTRHQLGGFPQRIPHLIPLAGGDDDSRIEWLVDWLTAHPGEKALLICKTREQVESLSDDLRAQINVDLAVFHEKLTLLQRDRNAAYFQDPEGARLLLCSEIGSEGRNFQFAQHLILWDLPENPELLEQRIGRLDRIGQKRDIHLHIPYLEKSAEAVWALWYHEGLDAFSHPVPTAQRMRTQFAGKLEALKEKFDGRSMKALIAATRKAAQEMGEAMERGTLRLLALNSFNAKTSERVRTAIERTDREASFEQFLLRLFEELGVRIEELGGRRFLLDMEYGRVDRLPGLETGPMTVTFDRREALEREDIVFLTIDHPLVRGALDSILGGELGNAAVSVYRGCKTPGLFLEVVSLLECVAPARLHVDRFLTVTPVGVTVNHRRETVEFIDLENAVESQDIDPATMLGNRSIKSMIPRLLETAQERVTAVLESMVDNACAEMSAQINREILRLEELAVVNPHVTQDEIQSWVTHRHELSDAIRQTRSRLDAVRLIVCEA